MANSIENQKAFGIACLKGYTEVAKLMITKGIGKQMILLILIRCK